MSSLINEFYEELKLKCKTSASQKITQTKKDSRIPSDSVGVKNF